MERTQVSESLDLLGYGETTFIVNHGTFRFGRFFIIIRLFSQVALQSNKDELDARAVFGNLGNPFRFDVLE